MTIVQFLGCGMIAFGPPIAMFILTIAHDPVRIIMLVASAFVWLLALLCSALIYNIFYFWKDYIAFAAILSVIIQEIFRYLWFILLKKAEMGLRKVSEDDVQIVENKHILAYVSGLGFGIMSGIFSLLNLLADMTGPGTVGLHGEPQDFFIVSSLYGATFILLQIFTSIIFFDALHKRLPFNFCLAVLGHLFCSAMTIPNSIYMFVLPIVMCYTFCAGIATFVIVGGSYTSLKEAIAIKPQLVQVNGNAVHADGI